MIERAGIRFNIGDYINVEIDTEGPTCTCTGTIDGEPVDFSGGESSNIISGSFVTNAEYPTTNDILLNYDGEGYPVAGLLFVKGLPRTNYDAIIREYGVVGISFIKMFSQAPTYTGTGNQNTVVQLVSFKNSSSNGTVYAAESGYGVKDIYKNSGAVADSTDKFKLISFKDNKTLSYAVSTASKYGLLPETEYEYYIIYSE